MKTHSKIAGNREKIDQKLILHEFERILTNFLSKKHFKIAGNCRNIIQSRILHEFWNILTRICREKTT